MPVISSVRPESADDGGLHLITRCHGYPFRAGRKTRCVPARPVGRQACHEFRGLAQMSRHDDGRDGVQANPFSPTAIARVSEAAADFFTVGTTATQAALSLLTNLLDRDAGAPGHEPDEPFLVALLGDHGTGKTHLCIELMRHGRRHSPGRVHTFYLDAPAATFLALQRELAEKISRDDLVSAIRHLPDPSPRALAEHGIRHHGLAVCLSLLSGGELADDAWSWIRGRLPSAALAARGVSAGLLDEHDGIQVIADLVTALGLDGSRVLLVVDEVEKILSASNRSNAEAGAAFGVFLEAMRRTPVIPVLSGVPDWLQVLQEDTRQQVRRGIVTMSLMTVGNTVDFIRAAQDRAFGTPMLAPFSEKTAEYVAQFCDGVPRRIARMCYQLYRKSTEDGVPVSFSMVRDVHAYFDVIGIQDVAAAIRQILERDGLRFSRHHLPGPCTAVAVDFWLPVGDERSGVCILLSDSVLKSEDADRLILRADAVRSEAGPVEIQLVVAGQLPPELARTLALGFGTDPLVHDPLHFADDLSTTVQDLVRRLETAVGIDPLTSVSNQLQRMRRRNQHGDRAIEQLADQLDEIRLNVDRRFASLHRAVIETAGDRRPRAAVVEPPAATARPELPERVGSLFDSALETLDGVRRVRTVFRDTFRLVEQDVSRGDATRLSVRSMVRSPEVLPALGVTTLLRAMVETFRGEVATWMSDHRTSAGPDELASLNAICRTYESEFEEVPLFRLDGLGELAARSSGHVDTIGQLAWSRQRVIIRETLERLAERVEAESLRAVSPPASELSARS
ncbi:hypothetical protein [Actinoplanes sp. NPDC049802]|uniref:hypothetical protein n=1 Tax=Actinoplanes sp. NPDC049802 TaxID=3154742 RepID=UPI0033E3A30A